MKDNEEVKKVSPTKNYTKTLIRVGVLIFIAFMIYMFLFGKEGVLAKEKEGLCVVPQNSIFSQASSGVYQVEGISEIEVFLLRGVIMGTVSDASNINMDIPPCYSNEPGLQNIANLYLINKQSGERISLILGVIGSTENFLGETEPDPLP